MKYWIGVASKEHVEIGVNGGFCQLCHGKKAPLNRMKKDDWLIYYAPNVDLKNRMTYQKFMALGQICSEEAYAVEMFPGFVPFRKNISYWPVKAPLDLHALNHHSLWQEYRSKLRFGHFEIPEELFDFIASGMTE